MRRPTLILLGGWMLLLLALIALHQGHSRPRTAHKALAKRLLLTDLCLSTESRHTRHISMPEYFAPFQDFPGYHEHFPSSSFLIRKP